MRVFYLGGSAGTEPPDWLRGSRLVAVGVIGKSPLRQTNKAAPLLTRVQQDEAQIECQWDERAGVVYLHLCSALDTRLLCDLVARLGGGGGDDDGDGDEDENEPPITTGGIEGGIELARREGDWLVAAGDLAAEACRSILLLFHICHVIIVSSPTPLFDLSYLHIFKALDAARTEVEMRAAEAVAARGVQSAWATHGRPCCPRVLFYFHTCPRQLRHRPDRLKRLRHCLEDQIYLILRKARVITNVCAKSLFAIPKNEEFVYMSETGACGARDLSRLVRGLAARCGAAPAAPAAPDADVAGGLRQFLQTHIDLALGAGFDDNVGKFATSTSYFEVPPAETWRAATAALAELLLAPHEPPPAPDRSTLWDALATDARFSAARCAKVLPLAQATYTEGLPAHYSTLHHQQKVAVAVGVFDTMARGPLCARERARLEHACAAIWKTRRLCEAPSLTGNPCIKPKHTDAGEDGHSSGVRYVSACNCGRTKCTREDPYSVRRANHTFYTAADCHVCPTLHAHTFPVFQPSGATYRAASLKSEGGGGGGAGGGGGGAGGARAAEEAEGSGEADAEASWSRSVSPAEPLSPGERSDPPSGAAGPRSPAAPRSPAPLAPNYELVPAGRQHSDKGIVRQPSTTEYLPGMLHTDSPAGLLPAFPSWSLVCLGASSLYSHNMGLPEHLHPGFLPHTNFLLPWDCAVRLEQVSAWRVAQAASRGRSTKPPAPHQLTVKIFLGLEYECPRGHRFMMASPDTVVSGGALGKDAGAELANTDMPLYCHCPCRGSKTMLAQLMRIHVVSPKAPVHITLNPKVQPLLGGAMFVPGGDAPVELSGSAYWLLRLPYVYCGERGVLPRPAPPLAPSQRGRLLAGTIGVTE